MNVLPTLLVRGLRVTSMIAFAIMGLSTLPAAKAVTIISATGVARPITQIAPNFDPLDMTTWPTTESNPWFATFTFSNYQSLPKLGGLDITLKFSNLDTNVGGMDYNNISLALGTSNSSTLSLQQTMSTVDTGIMLNGFTNSTNTVFFFGNPNTAGNASTIYNLLQSNGGVLYAALYDRTSSPTNPFAYNSGNMTLQIDLADAPIPFTPTQTIGLCLVALALIGSRWASVKRLVFAR